MNVIFLDVDGVLNRARDRGFRPLCKELMLNLGEIVRACRAKIVISSTWKLEPDHKIRLLGMITEVGLDTKVTVIGSTPDLSVVMLGNNYPRNGDILKLTQQQVI